MTELPRLYLHATEVMEKEHILRYIAYCNTQSETYVTQADRMGMSDGWVSELYGGGIEQPLYPTRLKVTENLRSFYGAAGIPQATPIPVVKKAPSPRAALDRAFIPRGGDPARPLAQMLLDGDDVPDEAEEGEETAEEEIAALVDECTPEELAERIILTEDRLADALQVTARVTAERDRGALRIMQLASQVTDMDNRRIRTRGEIAELQAAVAERDKAMQSMSKTIEGQEEDCKALEARVQELLASDLSGEQRAELEALREFKDAVTRVLGSLHTLMHEIAPMSGSLNLATGSGPRTYINGPSDAPDRRDALDMG